VTFRAVVEPPDIEAKLFVARLTCITYE